MSHNFENQYGYAESVFSYKYVTDSSVLSERPSMNAPVGLYAANQNPRHNIHASSELMGLNTIIGKCGTVTQQEAQNNLELLNDYNSMGQAPADPTQFLAQNNSQMFDECGYKAFGVLESDVSTIIQHVQNSEMIGDRISQMGAFTRQDMKDEYSESC